MFASLTVGDELVTRNPPPGVTHRPSQSPQVDAPTQTEFERVFGSCDTSGVAGGMLPGRSGRSLGERAANSGVRPDEIAAGRPAAGRDTGEGRHCWVHDPPDTPGIWPGLLVEWRQRDGAWQGRVAYTVSGPYGSSLVEAWLPAGRLEPR